MELEIFDNLFTKVLPKPPIYGLKDEVFVQASMAAYDQLELFPLNCWSTMDKDPNHRIRKASATVRQTMLRNSITNQ
jgi:hypothetical protein